MIAGIAFVAHPSTWRAKFTSIAPPSRWLFGLVAVAAMPLVLYAIGQLDIHTSSGTHDEHYEFGHWVVMAMHAPGAAGRCGRGVEGVGLSVPVVGCRTDEHHPGIRVAWHHGGLAAVRQLVPLAIGWGIAFIVVGGHETPTPVAEGRASEVSTA